MDTLSAFARGEANRGKDPMVFDWIKAARMIAESGASNAEAGLSGDWEWTGGEIFSDGKPLKREDSYTYLSSTWARPQLLIDGMYHDCFVMKSTTEWDSDTFWPPEALQVLNSELKGEDLKWD